MDQELQKVDEYYDKLCKNMILDEDVIVLQEFKDLEVRPFEEKYAEVETLHRTIEGYLFQNICKNQSQYLDSINIFDECSQQGAQLINVVVEGRRQINLMRKGIALQGIKIKEKIKCIQNVESVLERLLWLKQNIHPISQEIQKTYPDPQNLFQMIDDIHQDQNRLKQIDFVNSSSFIEEKVLTLKKKAQQIYLNSLTEFDTEKFDYFNQIIQYLYSRNQSTSFQEFTQELLLSKLQTETFNVIKKVEEDQQQEQETDQEKIEGTNLEERVAQIQHQYIQTLFHQLYFCYYKLMINNHLIIRYYKNKDQSERWKDSIVNGKLLWQNIQIEIQKIWNAASELTLLNQEGILFVVALSSIFIQTSEQLTGKIGTTLRNMVKDKLQLYFEDQKTQKKKYLINLIQSENFNQIAVSADRNFNLISKTINKINKLPRPNHVGLIFTPTITDKNYIQFFQISDYNKLRQAVLLQTDDAYSFSKYNSSTYLVKGRMRDVLMTQSGNYLIQCLSFYLNVIGYFQPEDNKFHLIITELLDIYIISGFICFTSEASIKSYTESLSQPNTKFDDKQDYDYYTNQFDFFSEVLNLTNKHPDLKRYMEDKKELVRELQVELGVNRKTFANDLNARITFLESLKFILNQTESAQNIFQSNLQQIVSQLEELIIWQTFIGMKSEQFLQGFIWSKWESRNEKEITQHQAAIVLLAQQIQETKEKLKQTFDQQLASDISDMISDASMAILFDHFSKVRKASSFGREQMISELQFLNKTLDQNGLKTSEKYYSQYEEYLKIFNNMSGEKILEFIYLGQGKYTYKQLLNLLNQSGQLVNLKKQQKREIILKMFKYYVSCQEQAN